MGSSGNLSKLVIPKQHWQELKGSMNSSCNNVGLSGPDSRGAQMRSKMQWWVAFCLCAGLVVVPFLMFMCAIDNMEAMGSKRQPWISLDGPPLKFIGVHSRWSLLRGGVARDDEDGTTSSRGGVNEARGTALQGMGTLLRVGTRAMQELIVAHLNEDTSSEELRLFLRSLHRSGATARADVVLLFPSSPMPSAMAKVIQEEEDSFQKLLATFKFDDEEAKPEAAIATDDSTSASTSPDSNAAMAAFNATAFRRHKINKIPSEDEQQDPVPEIIWGRRHTTEGDEVNPSWASWGSIVSFDIQELDPQDALQGFFGTPPVQLRRWVCYDMLLGMIKSRYKNVLVSQVKGVYVLGDALSAARKKPTLYITAEDMVWRDAQGEPVAAARADSESLENEDSLRSTVVDLPAARHESIRRSLRESSKLKAPEADGAPKPVWRHMQGLIQSVYGPQLWNTLDGPDKQHVVVSPAVIMGGLQYVRGLANKMTSEIVRVAMERKSRRTFHDKAVLNMWVHKKAALGKRIADHLKVVKNQDSVVHSVQGSHQPSLYSSQKRSRYLVVHDHAVPSQLREELCRLDPSLYQRCL